MVDSLDLLGVAVVPITVLIDEAGIVRSTRPRGDAVETFLAAPPAAPATANDAAPPATATETELARAHHELMFGDEGDLEGAIATYEQHLADDATGATHFHLGVALRRRSEGRRRQPGDFAVAIDRWQDALAINPNQYIWRRRIQQYGPRLDKPVSVLRLGDAGPHRHRGTAARRPSRCRSSRGARSWPRHCAGSAPTTSRPPPMPTAVSIATPGSSRPRA